MKLDWITDPHLDHLPDEKDLIKFVQRLHDRDSDGLMITGDIAESPTIYEFLGLLSGSYQRPIYFVLGNHDYYKGWMGETKQKVREVCKAVPDGILNWMTEAGPLHLEGDTWIVGHDGWYDGQAGHGVQSKLGMTDALPTHGVFDLCEAAQLGKLNLFLLIKKLGMLGAAIVDQQLHFAIDKGAKRIFILTHVPPFWEASQFRGKPTSAAFAPFYINKSMGDMLEVFSEQHPEVQLEVFAGHTHGGVEVEVLHNVLVRVGSARYGSLPIFQAQVEV